MQPNAFILLGEAASVSEAARATAEERPPLLNSAGVHALSEVVDGGAAAMSSTSLLAGGIWNRHPAYLRSKHSSRAAGGIKM